MKSWDIVIVGGGVIGLSLAWNLRKHGTSVLVIEKSEPSREATWAAGGMIAHCDPHIRPELIPLASASARMYREFVLEIEDESGQSCDLRDLGTLAVLESDEAPMCEGAVRLTEETLAQQESGLNLTGDVFFLPEFCVDPRALGSALEKSAKHRGADFVTGSEALEVPVEEGRASGVRTNHSFYPAGAVVNCAGAWASQLKPFGPPTRPVKGQMVCVVPQSGTHHSGPLVRHVVRTPEVYIIPRTDGRILLGATVEEAGFDKRVGADIVHRLHDAAVRVAPVIGNMRIHDTWAGLRPGSPDDLPILGEASLPGYFAATGHYRDGIMLAPITAQVMTRLLMGKPTDCDLAPFSPQRFGSTRNASISAES